MKTVLLKIRRQDDPGDLPYWEQFVVELKAGMTVVDALEAIREQPVTADGNATAPVAFESACAGGLCGACAMVINGRVQLACATLLEDCSEPVAIEPLSKFPVVRDLRVDRARMLEAFSRMEAWAAVDGLHEHGPALSIAPEAAAVQAANAACIMCGACSEACPQVNERSAFAGAFLFAQLLPLASHPIGARGASLRMDEMLGRGGIADCAGARACEAVCPQGIPLGASASALEALATRHALKRLFRG